MSRPKLKVYDGSTKYKYAHLKRDGIWLTITITPGLPQVTQCVRIETRHPTDITRQLFHHPIMSQIKFLLQPAVLYCELFALGKPASAVKHYLAEGEMSPLRIEAFASPSLDADKELEVVEGLCMACGVDFAPWSYDAMNDWHERPDAEGLVYKDGNLLNWAKLKHVRTVDAVVVDTKEGEGKYLGLLGALIVACEGQVIAAVSGMTDAERIEMSDNDPTGRVAEVAYQYVGSGGRLRHPRFVRWRDDKKPDECLLEQLNHGA